MFVRTGEGQASESVADYVSKVVQKKEVFKTMEDKELEREMQKMDKEVVLMIEKKKVEFSFEVKQEMDLVPEVEAV